MATKRQISKVLYKWEEYDIIWANVNDVEVSIKNWDWTTEYWKFSTNQKTPKTINIPVPNIDSALNWNSTNPVQNKVVKQALDDKITNPSGWNAWQVLKKTANWEEWADESWWWWDEIVYLTQDEYNALTPEEKMNGTHYGIVWTSSDPLDSYRRFLSRDPLGSWTIPASTTAVSDTIPNWANLLVILSDWPSVIQHNVYSINELRAIYDDNSNIKVWVYWFSDWWNPRTVSFNGDTIEFNSNNTTAWGKYYFF